MLSIAFARSAARNDDTYSWSFFSSRARRRTHARRPVELGHGPGRAGPLGAEEERVAGWRRAALRYRRRDGRQQAAHFVEFRHSYARSSFVVRHGGISKTLESWWSSTRARFLWFYLSHKNLIC